jgi:hypothetical protein
VTAPAPVAAKSPPVNRETPLSLAGWIGAATVRVPAPASPISTPLPATTWSISSSDISSLSGAVSVVEPRSIARPLVRRRSAVSPDETIPDAGSMMMWSASTVTMPVLVKTASDRPDVRWNVPPAPLFTKTLPPPLL